MSGYPLPSFGTSFLTSAILLSVVVVWVLFDPKFSDALELGFIDLHLQPHPGFKQSIMDEVHSELRWRLLLLGTVASLSAVSSGWMLWRLLVGNPGGRSIAAMLVATALAAGWLCLFTQFHRLNEYAIEFRIKRQVSQLAVLAKRLSADWPREDIEIPPYGRFGVDREYHHLLMSPDKESQPLFEKMAEFVRNHDGAIMFEFQEWTDKPYLLEFHFDQSQPLSFEEAFLNFVNEYQLDETEALGDGIYLSRYLTSTRFLDAEMEEALTD